MLIGCGCNCSPEELSSVPSGSSRNENSQTDEIPSNSLPGPPLSFCGVCRNLPAEWSAVFKSEWFKLQGPPLTYHDCSGSFGGTYTLQPYGAAAISGAAAQYLKLQGFETSICAVWQSAERALFSGKKNHDGSNNPGCRNNRFGWPRVELVSWSIAPADGCSTTYFVLFFWTADSSRGGILGGFENQEGFSWGWTVTPQPGCETRNCVRCWGADFDFGAVGMPVAPGSYMVYGFDTTINEWQRVVVCPA